MFVCLFLYSLRDLLHSRLRFRADSPRTKALRAAIFTACPEPGWIFPALFQIRCEKVNILSAARGISPLRFAEIHSVRGIFQMPGAFAPGSWNFHSYLALPRRDAENIRTNTMARPPCRPLSAGLPCGLHMPVIEIAHNPCASRRVTVLFRAGNENINPTGRFRAGGLVFSMVFRVVTVNI